MLHILQHVTDFQNSWIDLLCFTAGTRILVRTSCTAIGFSSLFGFDADALIICVLRHEDFVSIFFTIFGRWYLFSLLGRICVSASPVFELDVFAVIGFDTATLPSSR